MDNADCPQPEQCRMDPENNNLLVCSTIGCSGGTP
jgi:hypothetical protein